jgi:hypothetical protein
MSLKMLLESDFVMICVADLVEAVNLFTEKIGFAEEDQMPNFVQFKRPASGRAIFTLSRKGDGPSVQNVEM